VLGELLDEERLFDHHLVDCLLEQLGEARHVDTLLLRVEIDRAIDLRGDQLLGAAPAQPDRLLDSLHACARQAEANLGRRRLQVVEEMSRLGHADRLVSPGSVAAADSSFPRLVSLAAHDLRTPLATIHGFAQTLLRMGDLGEPKQKYMEMIDAASRQLAELLDELGTAARIEGGRYEPSLQPVDTLELAHAAADQLGEERVRVTGEGGEVHVDPEAIERGVSALAQAALRHGGLEEVGLQVDGATLTISPVTASSAPVVLGEELRDLGAAVAVRVVRALGGEVEVKGDALTVRLPQ
jgi:signal transduction histidine kinase